MVKKYGYDYSETLSDFKITKKLFSNMTKKEKTIYSVVYLSMLIFLFLGFYSLFKINLYLGVLFIAIEFPLGWIMQRIRRGVKARIK